MRSFLVVTHILLIYGMFNLKIGELWNNDFMSIEFESL